MCCENWQYSNNDPLLSRQGTEVEEVITRHTTIRPQRDYITEAVVALGAGCFLALLCLFFVIVFGIFSIAGAIGAAAIFSAWMYRKEIVDAVAWAARKTWDALVWIEDRYLWPLEDLLHWGEKETAEPASGPASIKILLTDAQRANLKPDRNKLSGNAQEGEEIIYTVKAKKVEVRNGNS